jgi:hypothetical protein
MDDPASRSAAFDYLLARSGVTLSGEDAAKVKELAKAMEEAAALVGEPLSPAVAPSTTLRLQPSSASRP